MLIDLSRPINEATPVYPGDPLFARVIEADYPCDGYRLTSVTFGTHLGTHLDAPRHFFCDGESLGDLPLETFDTEAVLCDLAPALAEQPRGGAAAKITPELLAPFADVLQSVPAVILRTGWGERWGQSDYFTSFPSILPETADWLADYPIKILGLDTPSLSAYGNALFGTDSAAWGGPLCEALLHSDAESHRILLGRRPPILPLENLAALEKLPAGEPFRLLCFPLPVDEIDGFPVRACAKLTEAALPFRVVE